MELDWVQNERNLKIKGICPPPDLYLMWQQRMNVSTYANWKMRIRMRRLSATGKNMDKSLYGIMSANKKALSLTKCILKEISNCSVH